MRTQDITEGVEYAVGDAYQWRMRFRRPLDFTARARVIEKDVLRTTWKGEIVRDGVKVHFLDPETGQPLTTELTPRPTMVLSSPMVQQDWAEFKAEHGTWEAQEEQKALASSDCLAHLEALVGDLDDAPLPDHFRTMVVEEKREPGRHAHELDMLIDLLEWAYARGAAGGAQ